MALAGRHLPVAPRALQLLALLTLSSIVGVAKPAHALDWWPFKSAEQRLVERAREARKRGDYQGAKDLLSEAERQAPDESFRVVYERAQLAQAKGNLENAAELLHAAAELEPDSPARVDRAAVLVELGRWPQAVEVLRRAFDERLSGLRAEDVVEDARFRPLARFEPFVELIEATRQEQAGPIGRLILKLEELESEARELRAVFVDIARGVQALSRLAGSLGFSTVVFILFALLASFGVAQLGVLHPPWTLLTGMTLTAVFWSVMAQTLTLGASDGRTTIVTAGAWVGGAWIGLHGGRWLWRRLRPPPLRSPFTKAHRSSTQSALERLLALTRQLPDDDRAPPAELKERLESERRQLLQLLAAVEPADAVQGGERGEAAKPEASEQSSESTAPQSAEAKRIKLSEQ